MRSGEVGNNNPQLIFQGVNEDGSRRVYIPRDNNIRSEIFGDKAGPKLDDMLRFLFVNINGLPNFKGHCKNEMIFETLAKHNIDVAGLSEINKNWRKLKMKHSWKNRASEWWENSHSSIAYNSRDKGRTPFQPSGNITHSIGKASFRVIDCGYDESGLGRWSWTRYRGKHDVTLMAITAYRPCKPSNNM